MATLFGLGNCDSCRKAKKELLAAGKAVDFHDVRADPLARSDLERFFAAFGDPLLNKKSTTWRGLSEAERDTPAVDLIVAHPTLMKRPVIEAGSVLTLGWDAKARDAHLG